MPLPWFESGKHHVSLYVDGAQVMLRNNKRHILKVHASQGQPCCSRASWGHIAVRGSQYFFPQGCRVRVTSQAGSLGT